MTMNGEVGEYFSDISSHVMFKKYNIKQYYDKDPSFDKCESLCPYYKRCAKITYPGVIFTLCGICSGYYISGHEVCVPVLKWRINKRGKT